MAEAAVLTLNAGSSSLKFVLFGAVRTRAVSGIAHFDELPNETALVLASDYTKAITGEVVHVDAGFHVEGTVFH